MLHPGTSQDVHHLPNVVSSPGTLRHGPAVLSIGPVMRSPSSRPRPLTVVHSRRLRAAAIGVVMALTAVVAPGAMSEAHAALPQLGTSWVRDENLRTGTDAWKIPEGQVADDDQLSAYSTQTSLTAGQPLTLRISSTVATSATLDVYRIGWYGGTGGRLVTSVDGLAIRNTDTLSACQAALPATSTACRTTWQTVTGVSDAGAYTVNASAWLSSAPVDTTDWPAGDYLLKLTITDPSAQSTHVSKYVPLVIRSTEFTGRTTLVNATMTWQAYNRWGGYSAYYGPTGDPTRSRVVTFDRPYSYPIQPDNPPTGGPWSFLQFERASVVEAERLGLNLAYATSEDLHARGDSLSAATSVVMLGHDEYWSNQMWSTMTHLRDSGVNLLFSGANSMWWRIRLSDDMRTMTIYKDSTEDPVADPSNGLPLKTVNFPLEGQEGMVRLLGAAYITSGISAPLTITDLHMFLFDGTGATRGQQFEGLLQNEVDQARDSTENPDGMDIAAHSAFVKGATPHWADITYYSTPSGAGVLNLSSMAFNLAMEDYLPFGRVANIPASSKTFARQVFDNALTAVARPHLGQVHPSTGNWSDVLRTTPHPALSAPTLQVAPGPGSLTIIVSASSGTPQVQVDGKDVTMTSTSPTRFRAVVPAAVGTHAVRARTIADLFEATFGPWTSASATVSSAECQTYPDASTTPTTATGALGDASGDSIADVWSVDSCGTLLWHRTSGRRIVSTVTSGRGWHAITALAQIPDVNGDHRSDLMARRTDGTLWSYLSLGNGRVVTGRQIGYGWNGMDIIAPAGRLSGSTTQYVVAREARTGDLYRYEFRSQVLTNKTRIGNGWQSARMIFSIGDSNGDHREDLAMIRQDGTLWLYRGTASAGLASGVQTGNGWTSFVTAFSPGQIGGSSAPDLVGLKEDGSVWEYDSVGVWWSRPSLMASGFTDRRLMA